MQTEYMEVFGSPNKVNAGLAKLIAAGWEQTGSMTKGYNPGQMSGKTKMNPTYLCITVRRATKQ